MPNIIWQPQPKQVEFMSREEYEEFCGEFATPTTESAKNGGGAKLRLKSESKALLEWLSARA